ncbi:hypothetical protein [Synechococcus sp. MIT S9452]|uniref:hypothetical protein n=1 Tax=Synechococcus sp. MIT S9452 TaxID=3082546 RepID=UPI0039A64065
MPRLSDLLLKNRRKRKGWVPEGSTDGLLDILSNVVGVMALVGSLTGVIAANSALNIQAPMSKKSTRSFHLVQVSANGLWDLQPAVTRMTELDRERGEEVRRCQQLLPAEQKLCNAQLDGWARNENIGQVSMEISHANGLIRAAGQPTISAAEIKNNPERLDAFMKGLSENKEALFIVLEKTGFDQYRKIKAKAIQHEVPLGWEPWYAGDPIYFWGNSGRALMVQ